MANQIPAVTFLTGQFLLFFEKNKYSEAFSNVHKAFLKQLITEPKLTDFNYVNTGTLTMLCYGLIVYPKELSNGLDEKKCMDLMKMIVEESNTLGNKIEYFYELFDKIDPKQIQLNNFVRLFRNSISHAHVDVKKNNKIEFWNINQKKERDFDAVISLSNLSILLSAIGKFYINIEKIDMEKDE